MDALGFDVTKIVSGIGVAPLPPVAKNDLRAIGRTNDCILYGGRARYTVNADDGELAEYMRKTTFDTVAGNIKFGARGEWTEPRLLLIQYRGVQGNDVEQFKQPGKEVILYPPQFKSSDLKVPFEAAPR